jgi:hypothetical protein
VSVCSSIRYAGLLILLLLTGCSGLQQREGPVKTAEFEFNDLAKSDIDMVAEAQLGFVMEQLALLTEKLYRRNPREWRKGAQKGVEAAAARLFGPGRGGYFPELAGRRSIEAMRLAFDAAYQGDRVLALMEGLRGMLLDAYNGKQEFYLIDELDPQKLYNSARNIEIVAWKLNHDRDASGGLFLFGKLIALQDSMAGIVAQATNRRIKNVIQSVASVIFFPI